MKMRCFLVPLVLAACTNPTPGRVSRPGQTDGAGGSTVALVAPDAEELTDAWADAIGGLASIRALGALHARGSYEKGGVIGTIDLWVTPAGERRETIELGFLRETRVFDGKRGWLIDRNREVRALAGFELDDQLALAFFASHAALVTDRRAGRVTRDGELSLVLAPDGGKRPETVTLDRATKLPATLQRRDGEKLRTTELSDWNAVDGVRLPFTVRERTSNPNDAVTIHYKVLEVATPPADAFLRPKERETDDAMLASVPVTVPIEVAFGGLIFVNVSINDTPQSFVFDTGAEATVINMSRLKKLGLQAFGTFATGAGGGDVELSFVKGVTTKLGGAVVSDQIVAAVLLDHLEAPLGRPLDGILGYDFISRFVVEIDYANQTMHLRPRSGFHHTGAGKAIAVTLEDSTPYTDAAIELPDRSKLSGHFVIDTGCLCDVQLFAPFVDQHALLSKFPHAKQSGFSAGAGGTTHEVTATIPALHLGDQIIKDPRADFARDKHGVAGDPETAGLIGSLTFKRYVLVLDYKGQQIFLDPPR